MRKFWTMAAAGILISFGAGQAHAGFLIEPYAGYEFGEDGDGDKVTLMNFGARAGWSMLGLSFGVDYMTGSGKLAATTESDLTPTDIGAFVSYEFPVLVRAYGVYAFQSELEAEGLTDKLKGTTLRLGAGYTGLPFVVLNFELVKRKYTKLGSASLTDDITVDSYMLNVSIPLP